MVSSSYCGIKCRDCPAFIATKQNNFDKKNEVAGEWSTNDYPLSPNDVECHGCTSTTRNIMSFCEDCNIRYCAIDKSLENCAFCDNFPCNKLSKVYKQNPQAKENLMKIRRA
ncbi:MAG: DUF3795 domain-containing protein [Candidatus Marinimicrobia bacterium]|nr:DUF3795 domain-containing protein [Candidatus Neomarinimicrobiota bacterium]